MSSRLNRTLLFLTTLMTITTCNPVPESSPNTNPLTRRIPVSNSAFTDWQTNIVMLGGSQNYGLYVPPDGTWYNLANIQCLDQPAYAIGPCDSPTIDQIGVASGNGPCSFVGINGWSTTMSGAAGEGFMTVGPPQRIVLAKCGS